MPKTAPAEPAFEGHRVEFESHSGSAVACLAPGAYPPNSGATGPSIGSETTPLRLPIFMRQTGLARLPIYMLVSPNRSGTKRRPWPHEATHRVNRRLIQVAAKEMQSQCLRKSLTCYGAEFRTTAKKIAGRAHHARIFASLTVLSLDGSDTVLVLTGELVADGALQP